MVELDVGRRPVAAGPEAAAVLGHDLRVRRRAATLTLSVVALIDSEAIPSGSSYVLTRLSACGLRNRSSDLVGCSRRTWKLSWRAVSVK